nr:MAG TPA: hypothetical protein [Caudoviricetes sp.]
MRKEAKASRRIIFLPRNREKGHTRPLYKVCIVRCRLTGFAGLLR